MECWKGFRWSTVYCFHELGFLQFSMAQAGACGVGSAIYKKNCFSNLCLAVVLIMIILIITRITLKFKINYNFKICYSYLIE